MKDTINRNRIFLIGVVLIVFSVIAYEPVRHNDFVNLDDESYVSKNPQVKAGVTKESIVWAFTTLHKSNWHPLTWLSHMLDCQFFGVNPLWHHVTNVILHVANGLLLFWVFGQMTGAVWPSAFVAAVFALHPLHVESVAWLAERKDVLSTFFWILTMAAYVRYAAQPILGRYVWVFVFFALGLMAKPMLVTLPFVLLLLDYWPLGRFQWVSKGGSKTPSNTGEQKTPFQKSSTLGLIAEKIPLLLLVSASIAITLVAQRGAMKPGEALSIGMRVSNALVSYISYIVKTIYPNNLVIFYPYPVQGFPIWQPVICLFLVLGITGAVLFLAKKRGYLAVGWFWYLGTLVPVIGLVQVGVQAMADRYTYIPSIGLFMICAWGISDILSPWRHRKVVLSAAALAILFVFIARTRTQVGYWKNSLTLFGQTFAVTKDNYIAHNNYGCALGDRNRVDEAIEHFQEALRINPMHLRAHYNLGVMLLKKGKVDDAISCFNESLRIKPDFLEAHFNLGSALDREGRLKEAINHFSVALRINPDYAEVHNNLANILARQGNIEEAIGHYLEALRINPDFLEPHFNLGSALMRQEKHKEAISHFSETLRIKPDFPEARRRLELCIRLMDKSTGASNTIVRP
jgi:tetratricopeptide (TPR) repeat protein